MIGNIRSSTDQMTVATSEIATGNADLSARTETQASSLKETASAMENLTDTVQQNASNAHQANQLAADAAHVAEQGWDVVSIPCSASSLRFTRWPASWAKLPAPASSKAAASAK